MLEQSIERRRIPYGAWVNQNKEDTPAFYLAHSLSPIGLKLLADDPPPPGRTVQLHLVVENEKRVVVLEGEVVSYVPNDNEPAGFAIRFLNLDTDGKQFLEDLFLESITTLH